MRALRFCHLTTFYPPFNFGGDGIGVQRLCRALARRGHHVTVVHDIDAYQALHRGPLPEQIPEPETAGTFEIIGLRSRLGLLSPLLTQQLGRPVVHGARIEALLNEGRFDVINFHNVSLVGGPGLLALGQALKLYMAHEHWLVCESHVLWRHGRELCTGRECLRCVLHHRRPPQLWRYLGTLDRAGEHVDGFIAMSEFSRNKHREFGFPFNMDVVPYFLPDADPAQTQVRTSLPHHRPYFLFVGRLERIKGLDEVIPLFASDHGADLLIAGDGEHAAGLRRLAQDIPRVRFLGRVPEAELASYYRHAVALIVPSICFETFGIILIEAFRHGTPVIARRLGPFPEIVETARAGELFTSAEELVQAMQRLVNDEELRSQYAKSGLAAFRAHWSEDAVLPRYFEVIARAARRKGDRKLLSALDLS